MALFENMLILVLVAVGLLHVSRRLSIPYPTMLALAGLLVAALPWVPVIEIDPQLALALFIAPALFDAAYDFSPRALKSNWAPLLALAALAVVLTTAAVAWVGFAFAGLPLAAAIALGAIVAPPDAAAATAVLARFPLPRRTIAVLKGESLFNDAVALLILGAAVSAATQPEISSHRISMILTAAPGGVALGIGLALFYVRLAPSFAGTLGSRLLEFVATFGAWVIAERLHLSAILSVVAFAMAVARYMPERQSARDRVHSYAVWEAAVFLLNVLAFLLMGLQARAIVARLDATEIWHALGFAGAVLATVVLVRIAWVLLFNRVMYRGARAARGSNVPSLSQGCIVSWCGMRGVVTLAAALSLPIDFPARDLIVLSSLAVVLGTLIGQGLTLGPLIRLFHLKPDDSFGDEVAVTRVALLDAALQSLSGLEGSAASNLREGYIADRTVAAQYRDPRALSEADQLRRLTLIEMRATLSSIRGAGTIEDDVFHAIQEELDWAELAASPPHWLQLEET
ncbi:sodium:proton antiporter [Sphingomonas oleivorans]|uniref:Sodium:proton antiporter n=1 Tax=Sphingomonas oleivorans TaxID=1735121 RepID=A0A2T5FUA8_9SPHN|nr:cation:proton antiporter [Sphingomonas oleivorans]PTQ07853.1 sodium:proton antiporter [Sphingomonas oleivorans]